MKKVSIAAAYDPPLDAGIRIAVEVLRAEGIETFESCEGGGRPRLPRADSPFSWWTPRGIQGFVYSYAGAPSSCCIEARMAYDG